MIIDSSNHNYCSNLLLILLLQSMIIVIITVTLLVTITSNTTVTILTINDSNDSHAALAPNVCELFVVNVCQTCRTALLACLRLLFEYGLVCCVLRCVKDHHKLLHHPPRLKKVCVRQVVLDKWFPPSRHSSKVFARLWSTLVACLARSRPVQGGVVLTAFWNLSI